MVSCEYCAPARAYIAQLVAALSNKMHHCTIAQAAALHELQLVLLT